MERITVPWRWQDNAWWNETCAKIVEHFGLPGGRYVTVVSSECMHFDFNNSKDALMCRLLISHDIS